MDLLNRREMLALLGAGAVAAAADSPFRFVAVDHVETFVSNVEKSVAFYTRIFGNTVLKNRRTSRRYLKLGSAYLAMDQGAQPPGVDHVCASIAGFDVAQVHDFLKARGIAYRDYPSGKDLAVTDLDGARIQLAAETNWNEFAGSTAAPESVPLNGEPIFQPAGIEHVLLHVADQEKSAAFYEKIFGPVTARNNNRVWFQAGKTRLGLLKTPAGEKPGVNHYCVSSVAKFDYDAMVKKLEQVGAKIEAPEVRGAPEFRDPDGMLVQVMGPR